VGGFRSGHGEEIRKTPSAVIVGNDRANRELNRVQVVPLTSNVGRLYPSEAYVILQNEQRKAVADQIAAVSKLRLKDRIGRLGRDDWPPLEARFVCNWRFDLASLLPASGARGFRRRVSSRVQNAPIGTFAPLRQFLGWYGCHDRSSPGARTHVGEGQFRVIAQVALAARLGGACPRGERTARAGLAA
jgi:mRNA interferase MazF